MDEKTLYNLLIEQEKHYSVTELGCGMKEYKEVIDGYWRTRYLLNTNTKSAYEIVGRAPAAQTFVHSVPDTPSLTLPMASKTPQLHLDMMYGTTTILPYKT